MLEEKSKDSNFDVDEVINNIDYFEVIIYIVICIVIIIINTY